MPPFASSASAQYWRTLRPILPSQPVIILTAGFGVCHLFGTKCAPSCELLFGLGPRYSQAKLSLFTRSARRECPISGACVRASATMRRLSQDGHAPLPCTRTGSGSRGRTARTVDAPTRFASVISASARMNAFAGNFAVLWLVRLMNFGWERNGDRPIRGYRAGYRLTPAVDVLCNRTNIACSVQRHIG